MGSFKTLEAFGFGLKRKHGNPLRKHIKFVEFEENLFIQVGLKNDDETSIEWTQYTPAEAKDGLKRLHSSRGPIFDLLASPVNNNNQTTTQLRAATGTKKKTTTTTTQFPWIPPARTKEPTKSWSAPEEETMESEST